MYIYYIGTIPAHLPAVHLFMPSIHQWIITRQVNWNLLSHPALPLSPHQLSRVLLAEASAEDHSCSLQQEPAQAANQMWQPTSNPVVPYAVCAEWHNAGGNLLCPCLSSYSMYFLNFSSAMLLSFMFLVSMPSLASTCLQVIQVSLKLRQGSCLQVSMIKNKFSTPFQVFLTIPILSLPCCPGDVLIWWSFFAKIQLVCI